MKDSGKDLRWHSKFWRRSSSLDCVHRGCLLKGFVAFKSVLVSCGYCKKFQKSEVSNQLQSVKVKLW